MFTVAVIFRFGSPTLIKVLLKTVLIAATPKVTSVVAAGALMLRAVRGALPETAEPLIVVLAFIVMFVKLPGVAPFASKTTEKVTGAPFTSTIVDGKK